MKTPADLITATSDKVLIQYLSPLSTAYAYKMDNTVYLYHVLSDNVTSISYNDFVFALVPSLDNYDYTIVSPDLSKEILNKIIAKYVSESFPI